MDACPGQSPRGVEEREEMVLRASTQTPWPTSTATSPRWWQERQYQWHNEIPGEKQKLTWKQALLLDLVKVNVPIRNSGMLLSTEFTAVLGHIEGRWQCPPWHALPSQFSTVQAGDPPGAMTASEIHVWGRMVCPCVPEARHGQSRSGAGVLSCAPSLGTTCGPVP